MREDIWGTKTVVEGLLRLLGYIWLLVLLLWGRSWGCHGHLLRNLLRHLLVLRPILDIVDLRAVVLLLLNWWLVDGLRCHLVGSLIGAIV
jgi:hypothetical protein